MANTTFVQYNENKVIAARHAVNNLHDAASEENPKTLENHLRDCYGTALANLHVLQSCCEQASKTLEKLMEDSKQ